MDIEYPGFGRIVVNGTVYEHDIVIEHGKVRAREREPETGAETETGAIPICGALHVKLLAVSN